MESMGASGKQTPNRGEGGQGANKDQGFEELLQSNPEIGRVKKELDDVIGDLDEKLNLQLQKQEHDYLKGYSIYVKTKEKELKTLIQKLNDKNQNNTLKDETIYKLNQKVDSQNKFLTKIESEKQDLSDKIKNLQARAQALDQDKNFLQSHLIESKRQNKLLKLAIGRLEMEVNQRDKTIEQLNKPIPITMANMDQ